MLGGAICLLASAVAISLFHRAKASSGRSRVTWIALDAVVSGCGIWATHFIAMLAYDPGMGAGYNVAITLLSLVFAIGVTAVGLGSRCPNCIDGPPPSAARLSAPVSPPCITPA